PTGFRKSSMLHQKIAFNAITAAPTINPNTAGLRYHGSPESLGTKVRPYTRPSNSFSTRGTVARLTTIVTTKHAVQAKIAIQKFCAMVDGNSCTTEIQPPLPSASVSPCVTAAANVPANKPVNAPWPVVRFQNMPSRNVANRGALTKENTSCSTSNMLL